jgi:tRNA dimethylallyltransferase
MWAAGLEQETAALVAAGLEPALRQLAAIGYDEALDVLAGRLERTAAQQRMSERTRQMAKRQRTWFRHQMVSEALDSGSPAALSAAIERIQAAAQAG